jgi:predicted nucleic acid-binding protein
MIVVDASVAVKWFIPEAGEEAAAKLLGGRKRLIAPALIRLEVTGAIIRRYREGHLSEKKAREGAQAWEAMLQHRVVRLVPDADLFDDAVHMAFLAKHTLADCLYLAVAKGLGAPVITADKPMRDRGTRAYNNITLLGGVEGH